MQKSVQNCKFFEERYATRQEWLAWFHVFKNNTTDNRSYADVVRGRRSGALTSSSFDNSVHFHSDPQSSANMNKNFLHTTDILKRHKHQSPVKHKKPNSPKAIGSTSLGPLQKSDTKF